jgi:hypothetical protein
MTLEERSPPDDGLMYNCKFKTDGMISIPRKLSISGTRVLRYCRCGHTITVNSELSNSRQDFSMHEFDGALWICGGASRQVDIYTFEDIDNASSRDESPVVVSHRVGPSMLCRRSNFALSVIRGELWAIGGNQLETGNSAWETIEKYDPSSERWTQVTTFPIQRQDHIAVTYATRIHVFGGIGFPSAEMDCIYDGNSYEEECHINSTYDVFDIETGSWASTGTRMANHVFNKPMEMPDKLDIGLSFGKGWLYDRHTYKYPQNIHRTYRYPQNIHS